MRHPARIDELLERLRKVWKAHPDLRLAQVIACGADGDPFYVEDEPLITRIENVLKERVDA